MHYGTLRTKYFAFLRNTDPSKFQSMLNAAQQPPSLGMVQLGDPYDFGDVDELLAKYDAALEQPPKSYEECVTLQ